MLAELDSTPASSKHDKRGKLPQWCLHIEYFVILLPNTTTENEDSGSIIFTDNTTTNSKKGELVLLPKNLSLLSGTDLPTREHLGPVFPQQINLPLI